MKKINDIDAYIADFPKDVQNKLKKLRKIFKSVAPKASELISYGIPTFKLNGGRVYFGGFRTHISVFPAPRTNPEFKKELVKYKGGKGTVQFPLDKPLPEKLIKRIVNFRLNK